MIKADDGHNGRNKDRVGKSADHKVIPVPVGTIVRAVNGKIVGDLDKEGSMFVAARGGAGKHIFCVDFAFSLISNKSINLIIRIRWQRK